jgi:hypothetical protein
MEGYWLRSCLPFLDRLRFQLQLRGDLGDGEILFSHGFAVAVSLCGFGTIFWWSMMALRMLNHCSWSNLKRIFAACAKIQPSCLQRFEQYFLAVRRHTFAPLDLNSSIGP